MDGIILVHKPAQITSHDVVARIRKILDLKKAGHFGTLDPLATGLLLIAVGKATRLFRFFKPLVKTYRGSLCFGYATDTYDSEGRQITVASSSIPEQRDVWHAMSLFTGEIDQVPPLYSAKKYKGRRLYTLARQNKKIDLKPSKVTIFAFEPLSYRPPVLDFKVRCSSGTYIRSLTHDLGQKLGCGAHLIQLERTKIGQYSINNCHTLERIKKLADEKKYGAFLIPLEGILEGLSKIVLDEKGRIQAKNGNLIRYENIRDIVHQKAVDSDSPAFNKTFRLFGPDGKLIAFAKRHPTQPGLHPFLVVDTETGGL